MLHHLFVLNNANMTLIADFPTQEYINTYAEAYANPNLTTWVCLHSSYFVSFVDFNLLQVDDYHQVVPKSSLVGGC